MDIWNFILGFPTLLIDFSQVIWNFFGEPQSYLGGFSGIQILGGVGLVYVLGLVIAKAVTPFL